MEKAEVQKLIAESINAAMAPIAESIGILTNATIELSKRGPGPGQSDDPEADLSQSVRDWLNHQRTGGLGGKPLDAVTPHNPRGVKPEEPSITKPLTGKEL